MLNLHDPRIQALTTTIMDPATARTNVTEGYHERLAKMTADEFWAANLPAVLAMTKSYAHLLADKLYEAIQAADNFDHAFGARLWFEPHVADADHATITIYLAAADHNRELLRIDGALGPDAKLVALNLPTLQDVTAPEPDLGYTEPEIKALSQLIKLLNQAGLKFASIDETVLQPVEGLTFATRYDNTRTLSQTLPIFQAGDVALHVALEGAVPGAFKVLDETGEDWTDLGAHSIGNDTFTWASTTIPPELIDGELTLTVEVRNGDTAPALDELFVIASSHKILMRQSVPISNYTLDLPNGTQLTVANNAADDTVSLHYPDPAVQVFELNQQFPFLGEWLKSVLPQKRAFN